MKIIKLHARFTKILKFIQFQTESRKSGKPNDSTLEARNPQQNHKNHENKYLNSTSESQQHNKNIYSLQELQK